MQRKADFMAHGQSTQSVKEVTSEVDFLSIVYPIREPCVIHGLDIGCAPFTWSADYLSEKCGSREVKVHVCPHQCMDFINKNFAYK